MKKNYQFLLFILTASILLYGCDKLQGKFDYNPSFYQSNLNMTVLEFMESRKDIFSGMLAAIDYVDADPAFRDVKAMYSSTGNTFLLMHNTALTNLEDATSYWRVNRVMGPNPEDLSQMILMNASDWSQYPRDSVALLLRYHVLKGKHTFSTLDARPKWVETFASTPTNDSAKVHIFLQNIAAVNLRINNYVGVPTTFKGVNMGWVNNLPRTPGLEATNGVIHVLNKWHTLPTLEAIRNN